jgi:cytidine deaminase
VRWVDKYTPRYRHRYGDTIGEDFLDIEQTEALIAEGCRTKNSGYHCTDHFYETVANDRLGNITGNNVLLAMTAFAAGGLIGGEGSPQASLAALRASLNATGEDKVVLARLDVGGKSFYGINAHGQAYPRPAGVTFQAMRHAEGDAFGQAARAQVRGGRGTLYVDGKDPCGWCRTSMAGFARSLDLDHLEVIGPNGPFGYYDRVEDKFVRYK